MGSNRAVFRIPCNRGFLVFLVHLEGVQHEEVVLEEGLAEHDGGGAERAADVAGAVDAVDEFELSEGASTRW